ncbi:MAG TPA: adenine deaminase C-terminal domain-containing protein, partial [Pirellulaceae bacterium]
QGSAARNLDALSELILERPDRCMLCTDDLHPDDLLVGHIDQLVRESLARGCPWQDVLRAACVNPVRHYGLPVGLLQVGDPADFLVVSDLSDLRVRETWIDGRCVARDGECQWKAQPAGELNRFDASPKSATEFALSADSPRLRVIQAWDGQLITGCQEADTEIEQGLAVADPSRDLLKLAVVNRYANTRPAVAFIQGIGLRKGAIASSVAHDCHNIVAVGTNDGDLAAVVNQVISMRGGLAAACGSHVESLSLPVAGLMSTDPCEAVASAYSRLTAVTKDWGSPLRAPFMTISFMALLVIPRLKLSDRGLFDGERFEFVSSFV